MTAPFVYPSLPHRPRHGPLGYADASSYRPWLRDEFQFRCVYCLRREVWGRALAEFAVDHFRPTAVRPDLETDYTNLLYAGEPCNTQKGRRFIADPRTELSAALISVRENGVIEVASRSARQIVEVLQLNAAKLVEFRATWIRIIRLAAEVDPDLLRRLQGFPADLPDLAALRPPGGNARPDGVEQSHFRRRERGELPPTY